MGLSHLPSPILQAQTVHCTSALRANGFEALVAGHIGDKAEHLQMPQAERLVPYVRILTICVTSPSSIELSLRTLDYGQNSMRWADLLHKETLRTLVWSE